MQNVATIVINEIFFDICLQFMPINLKFLTIHCVCIKHYICAISWQIIAEMSQSNHQYSYKRTEHLKQQRLIDVVFQQNKIVRAGQIKLVYAVLPATEFNYQVAFVAPKKVYHFAVDRNRCKRLMREAFRLNRTIMTNALSQKPVQLLFMFIAQSKEKQTFAETKENIVRLLELMSEKVLKSCDN